ncbi:MAG: N-acyl-D-amino-acid deacylase family protein, partial [Bryobacteraceae bacterium]
TKETLRLVEDARKRGVDVTVDQYPYTASSTGISALFPQWSLEGGREALLERLAAAEQRARIKGEIVTRIVEGRGGGDARNIVIANCPFDASIAGRSLAGLAIQQGRKPSPEEAAEIAMELQKKGNCTAVYHAIAEEDVDRIMRRPYAMIASDGGIVRMGQGAPHPRNYGTFARVLGMYVRERGIVTLEEAIRKMTSFPAARLKIWDRGLLMPGMIADIVVFDADRVKDEATFEKPHQYATGFRHVFVNGKAVLLDARMTGERPGRVLYGPGAATSQR